MNRHKMKNKVNYSPQIQIHKGVDILFHPKGIIKIWTRTGDKCPYSEKIVNEFYEKFDDLWNFIFVKEVFFDDKNGNVGCIEIDYFCPWKDETNEELLKIGIKTLGELWLDGFALILNWNVKFPCKILKEKND